MWMALVNLCSAGALSPGVLHPPVAPTGIVLTDSLLAVRRQGPDRINWQGVFQVDAAAGQKLDLLLPFSREARVPTAVLDGLRGALPNPSAELEAFRQRCQPRCEGELRLELPEAGLPPLGVSQVRLMLGETRVPPRGVKVVLRPGDDGALHISGELAFEVDLPAGQSVLVTTVAGVIDLAQPDAELGPLPLRQALGGWRRWSGTPTSSWIALDRELLRSGLEPELPGAPGLAYRSGDVVFFPYFDWEPDADASFVLRGTTRWPLGPPPLRTPEPGAPTRPFDPYSAFRSPAFPGMILSAPSGSTGRDHFLVSGSRPIPASGGVPAAVDGGLATAWCSTDATPSLSFDVVTPANGLLIYGGDRSGWLVGDCVPDALPLPGQDRCLIHDPVGAFAAVGRPLKASVWAADGTRTGDLVWTTPEEPARLQVPLEMGRYTLRIDESEPGVARGAPVCVSELVVQSRMDPRLETLWGALK